MSCKRVDQSNIDECIPGPQGPQRYINNNGYKCEEWCTKNGHPGEPQQTLCADGHNCNGFAAGTCQESAGITDTWMDFGAPCLAGMTKRCICKT